MLGNGWVSIGIHAWRGGGTERFRCLFIWSKGRAAPFSATAFARISPFSFSYAARTKASSSLPSVGRVSLMECRLGGPGEQPTTTARRRMKHGLYISLLAPALSRVAKCTALPCKRGQAVGREMVHTQRVVAMVWGYGTM